MPFTESIMWTLCSLVQLGLLSSRRSEASSLLIAVFFSALCQCWKSYIALSPLRKIFLLSFHKFLGPRNFIFSSCFFRSLVVPTSHHSYFVSASMSIALFFTFSHISPTGAFENAMCFLLGARLEQIDLEI